MTATPQPKHSNLAIDARRADLFLVKWNDPAVKLTVQRNKEHPRYDPRVEWPLKQELVDSMRLKGQVTPARGIKVSNDYPQVVEITQGRQRLAAWQALCAEMAAAGVPEADIPPFRIEIKKYGSGPSGDIDAYEDMVAENVGRQDDSPIQTANKVRGYLARVGDDEETRKRAATLFGVASLSALRTLLALLETDQTVQQAVQDGTLSPSAGRALGKLPTEQQKKAVAEIRATPRPKQIKKGAKGENGTSVRAVNKRVAEAQGKKVATRRTDTEVRTRIDEERALLEESPGAAKLVHKRVIEALYWVLGEGD